MPRALRALAETFAYFTILPVGALVRTGIPGDDALSLLPLVGAVVGGIAGSLGYAAAAFLYVPWAFVVTWAAAIALTGAIHVDGFLDTCDGLLVTATPQRRLEILKDPRHGTFAVVGMTIAAAFWLAALASIAPARFPIVLAFSGAAARLAVIPNAWIFPHARVDGQPKTVASHPNIGVFVLMFALTEFLAWFVAPRALAVAPVAVLAALAGGWWASRRLGGGLTGDVYGALVVTIEVLVLLAIAA